MSKLTNAKQETVISAFGLAKWYSAKPQPLLHFARALLHSGRIHSQDHHGPNKPPEGAVVALHPVDFEVKRGEVLGVVGKNGAGKSTLMQLVCKTILPTAGSIEVKGRIAALLELGAGFNPEFTGIENVRLNAALQGLSLKQIDEKLDAILSFADIGEYVSRPVKTYSSGMFVRLAFAVAVCVDPEILVIDEALSVGDGSFARKSFQRIMSLRESGTTILFCSHSLYQVEALCDRVMWLHQGRLKACGLPADVLAHYGQFLDQEHIATAQPHGDSIGSDSRQKNNQNLLSNPTDYAQAYTEEASQPSSLLSMSRIVGVKMWLDGVQVSLASPDERRKVMQRPGAKLSLMVDVQTPGARYLSRRIGESDALTQLGFPTVAVTFTTAAGQCLTAISTLNEPAAVLVTSPDTFRVQLEVPQLPLKRGVFRMDILVGCERGLQLFDHAIGVAVIDMRSSAAEQGLVEFHHRWVPADGQ